MKNIHKDEVSISILDMMVERLRIANYGNLLLVVVVSAYLWNTVSKPLLILWVSLNVIFSLARSFFAYRTYAKTTITKHNVHKWLRTFCITLFLNNIVWSIAFVYFLEQENYVLTMVTMFCFFTLVTSAAGTLTSYIPAFISHSAPLAITLIAYFTLKQSGDYLAYSVAVILFFSVSFLFIRSSNQNILNLIHLQLQEKDFSLELSHKSKLAETALEDKNRFLAAASHDLRQPLHSIGLLISSLKPHIKGERAQSILADTQTSMDALSHSFNGLLDMSRLDAGVVLPTQSHFSCDDLCQELIAEFDPIAKSKQLDFIVDYEDNLYLFSDTNLIRRILKNLISNALNYTHTGKVHVTLSKADNNQINISVKDTGIGIAEEQQKEVFSEYFQINNPERDRSKGFGLGLSIVKRLVSLLDISIEMKSERQKGSEFSLKVPAGDQALCYKPKSTKLVSKDLEGLRILVIDDDIGICIALEAIGENWGSNLISAQSAQHAIELINEKNFIPQIILSDFRLKDNKNGLDAIETVNEEINKQLPALLITGETSTEQIKLINEGGYPVLHKPVSEIVLKKEISNLLNELNN